MARNIPPEHHGTLLVSCPDQRGIVAALGQVLHGHGANILSADQHRDETDEEFFQRIEYDTSELFSDQRSLHTAFDEVSRRFNMKLQHSYKSNRPKIVIFVSRYDHCLYDLLWRHQSDELPGDIAAIISNHETLAPIAAQFSVPFHCFPITKETKREQEQKQLEVLKELGASLVILARYMQILSAEFVQQFPGAVINIHHSFLPAFSGGKPYHQAHQRGVKLIGATAHYATANLDQGPIIAQDVIQASHRDGVDDLVRKGRDVERAVLGRAVRWHLQQRVLIFGNKTIVFE